MCVCFTLTAILPELYLIVEVLHQARQIFIFMVQIPHVSKWFIAHTLYCKVPYFAITLGSLQAKGGLAWQKLRQFTCRQLEFSMYKPLCVRGPQKRPRFASDSQKTTPENSAHSVLTLWLTTVKTDTAQSAKGKGAEARPRANQGQASGVFSRSCTDTPDACVQPARYREAFSLEPRRGAGPSMMYQSTRRPKKTTCPA